MKISRRTFLGMGGASALGSAVAMFATPSKARAAEFPEMKTLHTKESTTICPYCGVGCQITYHLREGKILFVEGRDGPAK